MIKSILPFCFLLFFVAFNAYSQPEKKVVAVMPFSSALPDYKAAAVQLQTIAIETWGGKTNIKLVDRSADTLILKELDNNIREQAMGAKIHVDQDKLAGAQEIIIGKLTNISVEQREGTMLSPGTKYLASISFSLQVVDVSTGTVLLNRTVSGKTLNINTGGLSSLVDRANTLLMADTREAAIRKAIGATKGAMLDWINEAYPVDIHISSVDTRNGKGFAEIISIVGFEAGASSGKTVVVYEITYEDDNGTQRKRRRQIAELKIQKVEGDFTTCKVKNGEDVLEGKMKSGAKLEFVIK